MIAYSFYKRTTEFMPSSASSYAFTCKDKKIQNRFSLILNSFSGGCLNGYSELVMFNDTITNLKKYDNKITVDITPITPFGLFANPIELTHNRNRNNPEERANYWRSKDNEKFYLLGNQKSFPFDSYVYGVYFTIINCTGNSRHSNPSYGLEEYISVDLPSTFDVISPRNKQELTNYFGTDLYRKTENIKEGEHWFIVKRAAWYKWFVIFLVSFLFVPLYLLTQSKSDFPSLEAISGLLSILAIRALLVGDIKDFTIYYLDGIFLFVILLIAIIPLVKIFREKNNPKTGN